jgi:hypothetical protein
MLVDLARIGDKHILKPQQIQKNNKRTYVLSVDEQFPGGELSAV